MRKALITGARGFVGNYLSQNLLRNGYEVWGGGRNVPSSCVNGVQMISLDLANKENISAIIRGINPDVIFHLSGQSSVKKSWEKVGETFQSNLIETINLFEEVGKYEGVEKIRIISIGSSEEYGPVSSYPITEESFTNPSNPYGISKLSISKLVSVYYKLGVDIVHARPFNHIGPGQKIGFVTSDFAKQIAEINLGLREAVIRVGDLSSKRDFTDVRDIVDAYRLLDEKGISGEVYNICSGSSISIQEILDYLLSFSEKQIKVEVDPAKLRPSDIPIYYGSYEKLNKITRWRPNYKLKDSLSEIYNYWLTEL
ncbi:GDP-mannose 4,6-dehydratase [Paenibacillus sp. P13VS]|uniref:GDP-mannose 4,6-dehydratase n=1 Tax=Paenibacillus sp. P13VS TaxID=2697367 RepID=UPI00187B4E6D|nr:GDP-mannose 4,6-dehydratase [Paenibacillus sp. P13VS]MBE7681563.1 NAD-dependent epimerase/dehydratase family protein [Paenibacillus sp. P13VS]